MAGLGAHDLEVRHRLFGEGRLRGEPFLPISNDEERGDAVLVDPLPDRGARDRVKPRERDPAGVVEGAAPGLRRGLHLPGARIVGEFLR